MGEFFHSNSSDYTWLMIVVAALIIGAAIIGAALILRKKAD